MTDKLRIGEWAIEHAIINTEWTNLEKVETEHRWKDRNTEMGLFDRNSRQSIDQSVNEIEMLRDQKNPGKTTEQMDINLKWVTGNGILRSLK